MTGLFQLFLNNLLPVFLIAGAGYLLTRRLKIDPRPISQVLFYLFTPCLIFNLLLNSHLEGQDIVKMMSYATLTMSAVGLFAWIAGVFLRLERQVLAAVVLTSMFMNAGNYGLPIILFAFGEATLSHASLYFVTMAILTTSVGALIASLGSTPLSRAVLELFRTPALYALLLAILFLWTGWKLPLPLERAVKLLSDATVPAMLVIMGLQYHSFKLSGKTIPLILANVTRLLVALAIALVLAGLFGLQGAARQAGVVEASMSTAVLTTVLAIEYNLEPAFVTSVVLTTTLLSPLTITPLLAFLKG